MQVSPVEAARKKLAALLTGKGDHDKDLLIPCPAKGCRVGVGKECRGQRRGVVHFGRRLARILKGIR